MTLYKMTRGEIDLAIIHVNKTGDDICTACHFVTKDAWSGYNLTDEDRDYIEGRLEFEEGVEMDMSPIIEMLQGTCTKTLDEAVSYHYPGKDSNDMSIANYWDFDNNLFTCDTCGWWCEIGDCSEDEEATICTECYVGPEEDDE